MRPKLDDVPTMGLHILLYEYLVAPALWSCGYLRLAIRPQINRTGRPQEEGSTTADGAKYAHVLCRYDGHLNRYLCLDERGEWRRVSV